MLVHLFTRTMEKIQENIFGHVAILLFIGAIWAAYAVVF